MEELTHFYRLLLDCHLSFCMEDCIIRNYSRLPITELIEKTRQMSNAELKNINQKHEECIRKTEHKFAS